ncbi:MAG TPA: TonB-dependent receptor [Chitinophagaceae bacterium]|nr:TonB-dependent receptor [Chitinophagaceae bacterium]
MSKLRLLLLGFVLFSAQILSAQTREVTGKVTDAGGAPMSNVSVTAKGSRNGTATGNDGTFTLNVDANAKTLIVSAIGFETQEIAITGAPLSISLKAGDSRSMDEVIVVGYGTKIKKDLTGNIARIKGSEVANTPVANFTQAIQGRAAGVFVESQSGKVGEGIKVRIRGSGSISASNSPLYVVDGVPINSDPNSGNSLADINFNDIETFDILKDASAAAIYGSRAANGVVLITTKKGRIGKTAMNVNFQYGTNKPTGYRGFLDARQYVDLLREAAINSDEIEGVDPLDPAQYSGSWLQFAENRLTRYSGFSNWRNLETNTNWEKLAFQEDAKTKLVDISASGGTDKTRFFISGGFNDQDGILFGNNFQRLSARFNLDHDASNRVKFGFNMSVARTIANRVADDNEFYTPMQIVALAPITPVRDQQGVYYDRPTTTYYNPLIELEDSRYESTTFRNIGGFYFNYKFAPSLVFKSEFGLDVQSQSDDRFFGNRTIIGQSTNGYGEATWFRRVNYNTNNYLSFAKILNRVHDIDATAGMSFQSFTTDQSFVSGEDFPVNALKKLASAGRITGGSTSTSESAILSYFARANYKLMNKYLVSLSGRIDGSSRFGKENKYGFFPAASAGWILSQENFLSSVKWLSFLKLRASYGLTGNDAGFGDFAQLGLWGAAKYNNVSGLVPTQLANPELKWEKSAQTDIGIDFGLFGNRLTGEIDYYVRNTRDLIYNVPVPGTSGFATQTVNIGSMENKGVEFVLNSVNVNTKSFKWNSSFNLSKNSNKVTKLDGDQSLIPGNDGRYMNSLIVGEGIGVFYGPKFAGADPANGDALYFLPDGKNTTNDYNDAGDFVVGDPNPDWIGGLNNTFSYKGIELSVLFQGVFGNQVMNGAGGFMSASFDWFDNQTTDQLNRWQNPGDVTNVPQLRLGYGNGIGASSRYVEDASYVRLKNITLAYNVDSKLLNKLKIRSARIYLTGVNLATFTNYSGWDPEVNTDYRAGNRNQGGDFYAAPQIKSMTFGINLGF